MSLLKLTEIEIDFYNLLHISIPQSYYILENQCLSRILIVFFHYFIVFASKLSNARRTKHPLYRQSSVKALFFDDNSLKNPLDNLTGIYLSLKHHKEKYIKKAVKTVLYTSHLTVIFHIIRHLSTFLPSPLISKYFLTFHIHYPKMGKKIAIWMFSPNGLCKKVILFYYKELSLSLLINQSFSYTAVSAKLDFLNNPSFPPGKMNGKNNYLLHH